MREYETVYLLKPDMPSERISKVKDKVHSIVKKAGGHVLSFAEWGKRKMAYEVKKLRHAQYFHFQYLGNGAEVFEIERILKYDDGVLKFLTVKLQDEIDVKKRLAEPTESPASPVEIYATSAETIGARSPMEDRPYEDRGSSDRNEGGPAKAREASGSGEEKTAKPENDLSEGNEE